MGHEAPSPDAWRTSWRLWLAVLTAGLTLGLGAVGYWRYEKGLHHSSPDLLSILYHTLQLLILHAPHLEPPVPWELHAARLLGACLFFAAGFAAFLKFFRGELSLVRLRMPWTCGHVVICGLGDLGLRIALDARARGKFVVAIEKRRDAPLIEQARAGRVLILEGNAYEPSLLRKARAERAEFVVAACHDDHTNVAIAAFVGSLVAGTTRSTPLVCRLLIKDTKTRELLAAGSLFPHTGQNYRINCSDLAYSDTAARQALRLQPLDFKPIRENDDTVVRLVVVGFDSIGRSLALQAARIAHFANEPSKGILPHITVVDRDPITGWADFRSSYAKLDHACKAEFKALDPADPVFVPELAALSAMRDTLVTYAFCFTDDEKNLRLGLELSRMTAGRSAQILIFQSTKCGFATLFPEDGRSPGLSAQVHPFGMIEDVFTWDVLLRESEDALASKLHEEYRKERAKEGNPEPAWGDLSDNLKESNRQAADHAVIKLRALGYHDEELHTRRQRLERFNDGDDLLLLAKMEHHRWCAERWLDGWEYGPRTERARKINRCLVPWDQLLPEEQKKDPEQIRALPSLLFELGRGIYR